MTSRTLRSLGARIGLLSLVVMAVGVLAGPSKPGAPKVHESIRALGLVSVDAQQVDVGIDAEMVGLSWPGNAPATFAVRGMSSSGWTEWIDLDGSPGERPDSGKRHNLLTSAGPGWVARDVRVFQVRLVSGSPGPVKLDALDVEQPDGQGQMALGPSTAGAVVAPPFIASRADWGADESWRNMYPECTTPDYASGVDFAVVHHTVNSNSYGPGDSAALIRGIYYFHTHNNGWCDIGYNFIIDRYGAIFQGRFGNGHAAVIGAHAGGFNAGSTGIALLGDFDSSPVPSSTYASLRDLLAWKLKFHGIDPLGTATHTVADSDCNCQRWAPGTVVTIPTIVGHRDVDSTGCPGGYLYALLPQLRQDVANVMNAPSNQDQVVTCDWNGDGHDTPALYQNGVFYIRQSNSEGPADLQISYGQQGYVPVCGDWNGDGKDTIGVYVDGWWYLRNSNTPGWPDIAFQYGAPGYKPVVGNWNGTKLANVKGDGIGVYVDGGWYLRQSPSPGRPDIAFSYGTSAYQPVVGDWNGDGIDGVGVFDSGSWYLRQKPTPGAPEVTVSYGRPGDRAVAGDWSGAGRDVIGVDRGEWWWLGDLNATVQYRYALLVFYA